MENFYLFSPADPARSGGEFAGRVIERCAIIISVVAAVACAGLPPPLPGKEITGEVSSNLKSDTTALRAPIMSPFAPEWYVDAVKTWDAPPLARQLDEDETTIPIGKGAVFVPRVSDPSLEPDVEVADSTGRVVLTGKPGRKFCLIPGTYSVIIGSGTLRQRITKWVTIDEGKVIPLYPTWAGLAIDVVSETNIPFRGQYEMARIDEFEPFGRTYGRDPNRGERIKTWVLRPGLYKIFGVGENYNTVNSYLTVRLLPGELQHFTIVQDSTTGKIVSGGVSNAAAASRHITSFWKYGLDVGGSILFNTTNDTNNSAIVFLTNVRINHARGKGEWDTKFFLDEELNFSGLHVSEINNTSDDFRIYSLYVWRLMHFLGPYGRFQFETSFFPTNDRFEESSQLHLFLTANSDSTVQGVDSTSMQKRLKPSFSPIDLQLGVGANVDAVTSDVFDMKFKLGFGYSQHNIWNQYQDVTSAFADVAADSGLKTREKYPSSALDSAALNALLTRFHANYKIIRRIDNNSLISYGPETSIDGGLRLGKWISAEGEVIVLFPIEPIIHKQTIRPNYQVNTTVSWRLISSITLDYLYMYQFSQPVENGPKVDLSQHRVWLRFSFNSSL